MASNQPVYVVKAMSEMLSTELVKTFQELDKKLSEFETPSQQIADLAVLPQTGVDSDGGKAAETEADNRPSARLSNKRSEN